MSGQAKRSRVRAAIRHREQVARLIALACYPDCEDVHCSACGGTGEDGEREIVSPRAHHVAGGPDLLAQIRQHATLYGNVALGVDMGGPPGRSIAVTINAAPTVATMLADGRLAVSYDEPPQARVTVLSPEAARGLYEQRPINANHVDAPEGGGWSTQHIDPAHFTPTGSPTISIGYTATMREPDPCEMCGGSGRGLDVMVRAILGGERFDVALARGYGERMVREGTAALETWVVYCDWLRAQGWSEDIAAEAYRRMCMQLPRRGRVDALAETAVRRGRVASTGRFGPEQVALRRLWAAGPGRGKRPGMDGAALVRLGKRLLVALEGQPSECLTCCGTRVLFKADIGGWPPGEVVPPPSCCVSCRGTGHNLAGVLAPVDWPAVAISKATDGYRVATEAGEPEPESPRGRTREMQRLVTAKRLLTDPHQPGRLADTRVGPRGRAMPMDHGLDGRITRRGWIELERFRRTRRSRGERRHDQRRARHRALAATVDEMATTVGLVRARGETDDSLRTRTLAYREMLGRSPRLEDIATAARLFPGVEAARVSPIAFPAGEVVCEYVGTADPDDVSEAVAPFVLAGQMVHTRRVPALDTAAVVGSARGRDHRLPRGP
jgi:hypothetical protein